MVKAGKPFENELRETFAQYTKQYSNFAWHRLPDTSDFIKRTNFITVKNPADFIVGFAGTSILIEAKSSARHRYQLSLIKEHQVKDMEEWIDTGNKAWFLICYRASMQRRSHPDKAAVFKKNMCWAIKPAQLLPWIYKKGKASVTWEEIAEVGLEVPRVDRIWDLSLLLGLPHQHQLRL